MRAVIGTQAETLGREAELPGDLTTLTLAELLDADGDALARQLKADFDRIRQADL